MSELKQNSILDKIEKITQIGSSLSVILGIVIALIGILSAVNEAKHAAKTMRLANLEHVEKFIANDTEIRPHIGEFLKKYDNNEKLMALLGKYESGEQAYLSDELSDFRKIGRHYDRMGALLKLGYIDFDLIFTVIPFPDVFWGKTTTFRNELKTNNWYEHGSGLLDFWENFAYLHKLYLKAREAD